MNSQLKTQPKQVPPQNDGLETWVSDSLINEELAHSSQKGIYNSQQQALKLGQKIGTGGEGSVYEIQGDENFVAKIYHQPPAPEKIAKLIALAKIRDERLTKFSAWPIDVLRDRPDGEVIGFVMKKIGQAAEVHTLHSPKSRLKKFPEASWAFLVHAATNIARAVAAMHEQGFVVGDLNPKNILITKKATVYILDCDSFQVNIDGKVFRCDAGFPDYTPPELQGVPFRAIDRTPEHDCFGLAVVIFQLLFLGRHPFSGRFSGAGEMPLEKAIGEKRFVYGADAQTRQMQPPPGTLSIEALPPEIQALFRRAFLATDRPNPNEWIEPLEKLAQSLQRCSSHSGHLFWQEIHDCPWCEIEARSRVRLFNFLLGTKDANRGAFRLDEIWREITAIGNAQSIALQSYSAEYVEPSEDVKKISHRHTNRTVLSIFIALCVGILTGVFVPFFPALMLMFLAGLFVFNLSKLSLEQKISIKYFVADWSGRVPGALETKFQSELEKSENTLRKLEISWKNEGNPELLSSKFESLARKKETLDNFAELRASRHRQLEEKVYARELDAFLQKYLIVDHPHATKNSLIQLETHRIVTAADLVRNKMRDIKAVDEKFLLTLMRWREGLIKQFTFDPILNIPKSERARIETELDELQARLETELSSAPYYLRNIKTQLALREKQLKPELEWFRYQVAQLQKNLAILTKQIPRWPAITLMIFSFFVTSVIVGIRNDFGRNDNSVVISPPSGEIKSAGDYRVFKMEFESGRVEMGRGNLVEAKSHFLSSMSSLNENYWSDEYTEMYYQLAVARKKLGELKEFNEEFSSSVKNNPDKDHWKLQLAISYLVAGNKAEAKMLYYSIDSSAMQDSMRSRLEVHKIQFP